MSEPIGVITKYAIKRCKTLGFIRSLNEIKNLTDIDQRSNVIFLTDLNKNCSEMFPNCIEYKQTDDLDYLDSINTDRHVSIYIDLAHEQDAIIKKPIIIKDISGIITSEVSAYCSKITQEYSAKFDMNIQQLTDKIVNKFQHYVTNNKYFDDKQLKPYILDVISYLYKQIKDTEFQEDMLYILRYNSYENYAELIKDYPVEFVEESVKIYPHTSMFEDIRIATDHSINKGNNKSYNRKAKDYKDNDKVNSMIQLQAFSSNMFVVIHGKKNCPIENISQYQNHDIITTLFRNGVHTTPISTYDSNNLSVERLIKHLHKLRSFDIIFIHPNLAIPGSIGEIPSEDIQPSYDIGSGEILAIMYRYIVLNFFPYCKTYDNDMELLGFVI